MEFIENGMRKDEVRHLKTQVQLLQEHLLTKKEQIEKLDESIISKQFTPRS